jgi:glycosyltransferase involved in cell wall biosynthesis
MHVLSKISRLANFTIIKRLAYLLLHNPKEIVRRIKSLPRWLRSEPVLANGAAAQAMLDAEEQANIVLLIDHELGGGANLYSRRMVAELVDKGATVLVFSFRGSTLSHYLRVQNKRRDERYAVPGYAFLHELAERLKIGEIIYNDGVSFTTPEQLPILLSRLKNLSAGRLTLLVHDFFMVCPSHCLLDDAGEYCGIPEISRCLTCLPRNPQNFAWLFEARNMTQWRELWGNVIRLADEIRVFSNDSLRLLRRAYPFLDTSRVVVTPHKVEYFKSVVVQPSYTATLRIGVVGNIGHHKGARVVQKLAREIKARGLDIQIVVIGTMGVPSAASVVRQTGAYRHNDLPDLIKNSGANIMLFPSICPETFSYVVQELVELNLPVACFDLGAPAERLSAYAKGLVLKETTPPAILDELILFHQRIYGQSITPPR